MKRTVAEITLSSARAAMVGLELVELRCEDEIAFSEAVDLVRPGGGLRLAPAQQNIRVMALRFRYLAYYIYESERSFEIGKRKRLRNVVIEGSNCARISE